MAKTGDSSSGKEVEIVIHMEPCPCPRPRVGRWGAYYPAKYSKWKKAFTAALRRVVEENKHVRHTGPLVVMVWFFATKPRTSKLPHPKPDVDNFAKSVLDASNGVLWDDDSQITALFAFKEWTPHPCPAVKILIAPTQPSSATKPARRADRKTT